MHNSPAVLILAAGKGTRMHSQKPKTLQTLLGAPMLAYVLAAADKAFGAGNILVVSGHGANELEAAFPERRFARQEEQLGTGHALIIALPTLRQMANGHVFVINGDAPLVTSADLTAFASKAGNADIAFATITLPDPGPYGRVLRSGSAVAAIVEARDFNSSLHGEPSGEVNAGMYWLRLDCLPDLLPRLGNNNKSGEYYLTDLIRLGLEAGLDVRGIACGNDANLLGVNTPAELAAAENSLAARVADQLLRKGVILHAPQFLRASPFSSIEPGAEIFCPCEILGKSHIATETQTGPNCVIIDSQIESGAKIRPFSHLEGARVGANALVGPYTRLRAGANLDESAHVGNFVELKKTSLGKGAKANHLAYLGDSDIGAGVNIGAGTITCNYDGRNKHKTSIGPNAFIGSNTALVAPVAVGADALVGAGSVITEDVPPGDLALGRARQINLPRK